MKEVKLFIKASSKEKFTTWEATLNYKEHIKELSGIVGEGSVNRALLLAILAGSNALKEPVELEIVSNNRYICEGINSWLDKWIQNNWKTSSKLNVANSDLWKDINNLRKIHKISAISF